MRFIQIFLIKYTRTRNIYMISCCGGILYIGKYIYIYIFIDIYVVLIDGIDIIYIYLHNLS